MGVPMRMGKHHNFHAEIEHSCNRPRSFCGWVRLLLAGMRQQDFSVAYRRFAVIKPDCTFS